MTTILITGGQGQLGQELTNLFTSDSEFTVFSFSRRQLDVTDWPMVMAVLEQIRPEIIIHAAAYTKVDQAQTEPKQAYSVNAYSMFPLASAARKIGARIIYFSTDYVFDGKKRKPYHESDHPHPLNVYGHSKLLGEQILQIYNPNHVIVRTSWLYGPYGPNFVKTIQHLAKAQPHLKVVDDQIGSPTYTLDLARFIRAVVDRPDITGLIHATNTGFCSWYEFAQKICELKNIKTPLYPCHTEDYPRPAPRPPYSVLAHNAIHSYHLPEFRPWQEALRDYLKNFPEPN